MAPKKKKGIGPGVQVWVKDKAIYGTDLYGKAEVQSIDEKQQVTVVTSNGEKTQELVLPFEECHQPHPGENVPDHCQLMFLSPPTLLENTRARYMEDKIHTLAAWPPTAPPHKAAPPPGRRRAPPPRRPGAPPCRWQTAARGRPARRQRC